MIAYFLVYIAVCFAVTALFAACCGINPPDNTP